MTTIIRPKTTLRLSATAVAISLAWLSAGCAGCEGPGLDIGVQVTPAPDLATLPGKSNPFLSKEGQGGLAPPLFTPQLPPKTPFILTVSSLQEAQRTLDSLHRSRLAMRDEAEPLSAQDMLDKLLALKHYRWVDKSKPLMLTMNAPKEHLFGEVLALALTSEEALMSAVPDLTSGVPIERPEAHSRKRQ